MTLKLRSVYPNRIQIKEHNVKSVDRLQHLMVQYKNIGATQYVRLCEKILKGRKN